MSKTTTNRIHNHVVATDNVEHLAVRRARDQTHALVAGLDILDYLSNCDQPAPYTELAARLDISLTTVYRTVRTLEQRGYLAQGAGRGTCIPTPKLDDLRAAPPAKWRLLFQAEPIMQALCKDTNQSCNLSVPDGKRMVVMAATPSPGPFGIHVPVGYTYAASDSAPGLAFAAFSPTGQAAGQAHIAAALRIAAERGYVQAENPCLPAVTDLSCPVMDDHRVSAVLSIPFITTTRSANQSWCLAALQQAAEQLSQALDAGVLVA